VQEHVLVRLLVAANEDFGEFRPEPALFHLGKQFDASASIGDFDERLAVRLIDRNRNDIRFARQIVEIRRAPDGRANAPVNVDAGIDADDADRAQFFELRNHAGARETLGDDDLAGNHRADVAGRVQLLVENRVDIVRLVGADI